MCFSTVGYFFCKGIVTVLDRSIIVQLSSVLVPFRSLSVYYPFCSHSILVHVLVRASVLVPVLVPEEILIEYDLFRVLFKWYLFLFPLNYFLFQPSPTANEICYFESGKILKAKSLMLIIFHGNNLLFNLFVSSFIDLLQDN